MEGLFKELHEEIHIEDSFEIEYIGVIHDESTNVGKVHLGLLYLLNLSSSNVRILENHKMVGKWIATDELNNYLDSMENWSRIVFSQFIKNHNAP